MFLDKNLAETKKIVCYYGSWATYRNGNGKFDVENLDPHLCTHAIYSFAGLDAATSTIKVLDPYNDLYDNYGKGAYLRFTGLKRINPQLKTILAVGGWNEGSINYSNVCSNYSVAIDAPITISMKLIYVSRWRQIQQNEQHSFNLQQTCF